MQEETASSPDALEPSDSLTEMLESTTLNPPDHNEEATAAAAEDDEHVVREIAAKLAPQVHELDQLLSSPVPEPLSSFAKSQFKDDDDDDDDDDSMNDEWKRLAASEQLLREELDMADNVGSVLGGGSSPAMESVDTNNMNMNYPPGLLLVTPEKTEQQKDKKESAVQTPPATATSNNSRGSRNSAFYTLADHAHTIGLQTEPKGGWYYVTSENIHESEHSMNNRTITMDSKEYVLPLPTEELQRLYVGLVDAGSSTTTAGRSNSVLSNEGDAANVLATPSVGSRIGSSEEDKVAAVAESTSLKTPQAQTAPLATMEASNVSIPESVISPPSIPESVTSPSSPPQTQQLPVRTVVFRIRPDVLCGAIMDAMAHALETLGAELLQRQGGRLRGLVGECVVADSGSSKTLPSYTVDAQLCTYRGMTSDNLCQRCLLLRVYHVSESDTIVGIPASTPCTTSSWKENPNRLEEAAAWVQAMESSLQHQQHNSWFGSPSSSNHHFPPIRRRRGSSSRESIQEQVSHHLLQHAKTTSSVLEGNLTIPILSKHDAPLILASNRWIEECWHELDTRDLCHSSLQITRFGAFPALPTLDVHFCQQLRRVCRDSMIRSLLKSAAELEQYARESEYACASLIQTLRPTFEMYQLSPPALPQALPLTAYPLEFVPPQVACPPWGMKVMEALNRVAAMTTEANKVVSETQDAHVAACLSSFQLEQECVELVVFAFQRQDDEEMSARLGRKNVQVMDRLAKMQAHKRDSIRTIRDSYEKSPRAAHGADEFFAKAVEADSEFGLLSPTQQVPLFKCSVLVGSATGTLYVTASHMLFSTKRLPVLGHNTRTVLELKDLEFRVNDGSSSMLNPLPTSISISKGQEELFLFRPSYGASRLVTFLEIVQAMNTGNENDSEELKFPDKGGLLYLYGDSPPPKS